MTRLTMNAATPIPANANSVIANSAITSKFMLFILVLIAGTKLDETFAQSAGQNIRQTVEQTIEQNIGEAKKEAVRLHEHGRTLVEAEDYSKASEKFPFAEPAQGCSGQRYLGYYWVNSWFEFEIDAPRMRNFTLSLRASSPTGTEIEVQSIGEQGETTLARITIPQTGSWTKYTNTKDVTIALRNGVQTLRFKNLVEGANIDYLMIAPGADTDVVAIQPVANSGPDINPLKGLCSGWWRNDDYASVGFQYIEWGSFEPEDDSFDWEYVESVLSRPGSQGRHIILQFVVDWDYREPVEANYLGPAWLLKEVGEHSGNADPDDPESRPMRATRYNEPAFIEEATEAIKALMDHYRDDPRIFVIQVGILGFWGEWHNFPRNDWSPTDATKFAVLEAYLKNLGPGGLTQVRNPQDPVIASQRGVGYTNGSATLTEHGSEFGKAVAEGQLWKNGPIHGEWPPNVDPIHWKNFFLTAKGEQFLQEGHYSTLLAPEPKEIAQQLPGWKQEGLFMKMHRQIGYNFQAKSVRYLGAADGTGKIHIEVELQNSGLAPFYKDWLVQMAVLKTDAAEVVDLIDIETDIRKLGVGETISLKGSCRVSSDPNMECQIGLRILQPHADEYKAEAWQLNARNCYVVLANDIKVVDGVWNKENALQGGWNILDVIQRRQPAQPPQVIESRQFPLEGSFRPIDDK